MLISQNFSRPSDLPPPITLPQPPERELESATGKYKLPLRQWPCKFCERLFSSCSNRQKHIDKVHLKRRYKCTQCDYK